MTSIIVIFSSIRYGVAIASVVVIVILNVQMWFSFHWWRVFAMRDSLQLIVKLSSHMMSFLHNQLSWHLYWFILMDTLTNPTRIIMSFFCGWNRAFNIWDPFRRNNLLLLFIIFSLSKLILKLFFDAFLMRIFIFLKLILKLCTKFITTNGCLIVSINNNTTLLFNWYQIFLSLSR
jgi:hypothetical protein